MYIYGFKVGKSLVEKNTKTVVEKIYAEAKNNCNIFIPEDYNVSTSLDGVGKIKNKNTIDDDEIILDIGPKTIEIIERVIDKSNTILWNGLQDILKIKLFNWDYRNSKNFRKYS